MRFIIARQKRNFSAFLAFAIMCVLLPVVGPSSAIGEDNQSIAALRQMGKAFASIAEKASPAVVGIKSERVVIQRYGGSEDWFFDPFSDDFFDMFRRRGQQQRTPRERKDYQTAQGSGFIISPDGYILTNNHLVGDAEKVWVELLDGRKLEAKIIGKDPDSDVAVVKIDADNLRYIEMADSDKLEVGEWVLAIGNPLGLSHTVTAGIVSAKHRGGFELAKFENFIQTDAAINFGNSGGPLIDLDGKAVGMNAAIVGASGNIGIGFAIPINMAKHIYEQLRKGGKIERGFLGVMPQDMDGDIAKAFGLEGTKGVLIPHVDANSAAEKAGIQRNDVVLEINGDPVESANDLRNRIAMLKPNAKVDMVIWRKGKRIKVTATLSKRDAEENGEGPTTAAGEGETLGAIGLGVRNLTEDLAQRYGYEAEQGVIISSVAPGSQAARKGLEPGMLILEVNQVPVKNTREFNAAMNRARDKGTAVLLIKKEWLTAYVPLTLK